jgi:hypothetical protein
MKKKRKQVIILLFVCAVAFLSFPAASSLAFGMIGRVPEESAWSGTVASFAGLVLSTVSLAASLLHPRKSLISRISIAVSAALSGSWLGFYYGDMISGFKAQPPALIMAALSALLMAFIGFYWQLRLVTITIMVLGIIAAYGLAFMCSTAAFAFLSTDHFLEGIVWGGFSLIVIGSIVFLISLLGKEIKRELS